MAEQQISDDVFVVTTSEQRRKGLSPFPQMSQARSLLTRRQHARRRASASQRSLSSETHLETTSVNDQHKHLIPTKQQHIHINPKPISRSDRVDFESDTTNNFLSVEDLQDVFGLTEPHSRKHPLPNDCTNPSEPPSTQLVRRYPKTREQSLTVAKDTTEVGSLCASETGIARPVTGSFKSWYSFPTDLSYHITVPIVQSICVRIRGMMPSDIADVESSSALDQFHVTKSHSAAFHAALWNVVSSPLDDDTPVAELRKSFKSICYGKAIRSVNDMISNGSELQSNADQALVSVMWLAHTGNQVEKPLNGPRQSPLVQLQNLHVLGKKMICQNEHAKALKLLVQMRGGLDALPQFAQEFLAFDIFAATQQLIRPKWKCEQGARTTIPPGFAVLSSILAPYTASPLAKALGDLSSYAVSVDRYSQQEADAVSTRQLIRLRIMAQHQLMSLQPSPRSPVYECCRLAGIIFSLIAILPIPLNTAPFPKLAAMLKKSLTEVQKEESFLATRDGTRLFLWIATMGVLASIGTEYHQWYLETVASFMTELRLKTWLDVKTVLEEHLWQADISDVDGKLMLVELKEFL